MQLHNHYSVCLYNRGQFTSVADPGEGNKDFEGKAAVDEYGRKFSYKCPVPECPRSISKAKPVGFKEWTIHAGVTHHLVEKVMEEEAVKTPAMKEVLAEVAKVRAEAGWCCSVTKSLVFIRVYSYIRVFEEKYSYFTRIFVIYSYFL